MKPITGIDGCCAGNLTGQTDPAELATILMNSRRLMSPKLQHDISFKAEGYHFAIAAAIDNWSRGPGWVKG